MGTHMVYLNMIYVYAFLWHHFRHEIVIFVLHNIGAGSLHIISGVMLKIIVGNNSKLTGKGKQEGMRTQILQEIKYTISLFILYIYIFHNFYCVNLPQIFHLAFICVLAAFTVSVFPYPESVFRTKLKGNVR